MGNNIDQAGAAHGIVSSILSDMPNEKKDSTVTGPADDEIKELKERNQGSEVLTQEPDYTVQKSGPRFEPEPDFAYGPASYETDAELRAFMESGANGPASYETHSELGAFMEYGAARVSEPDSI